MKIHLLDNKFVKPLNIKPIADSKLKYKGFAENFDFGLRLQTYNLTEGLRDRKSNFNTSYFLSDLKALSSVMELDVPYTFDSDSKFTTYVKNGSNYLKHQTNLALKLNLDTNFNTLSTQYFWTFNLSTNELLYITKEINNSLYYVYADQTDLKISTSIPDLSSHLFRFNIDDNKIKLFPLSAINHPDTDGERTQVKFTSNCEVLACSTVGNDSGSVLEISRNTFTYNKKALNNSLSFYLSSFNRDDVNLNLTTTIQSVSTNFLLYSSNYSVNVYDDSISGDIIPLKNQATTEEYFIPSNHFNSQPENLNRQYEKIFSGNNNETGHDKIYLSYNIGTKELHFPPSRMTYFTTPSSMSPYTKLNINDSKIDYIGAVPGNNPLLSDKVFKRRVDIKDNTFTDDINATYLCSWLSGNEDGQKIWIDRFYNAQSKNFSDVLSGTFFYDTVTSTGLSTTHVFDVSSNLTFEPNNDYAYYHIGEEDYSKHLEALEKYLLSSELEVLNNKGAIETTNQVKDDVEIDFNGDRFGKFVTNKKGDFSFSFWLSAQDYSLPLGYQLLGNYFEEGFGVFNTELVTPNMYLPHGNKLMLLNTDLEVYDEIELLEEGVPVNIKGVARKDIFSEFYILGENNVIYVYNSNPNLVSKITDLSGVENLVIDDMDVTEDRVYLSFNPYEARGKYFYYDISTNETLFQQTTSADSLGRKSKFYVNENYGISNFEADNEIETGNEFAIANNDNFFTIKQRRPEERNINWNFIYKNLVTTNTIELTGGTNDSIATNIIVDDDDNLIILFDQNRISKTKNTRELITTKTLDFLDKTSKKYIDLIYDFEDKTHKRYILIIENLSDRTLLHKLDFNFNLVKTKSLGSVKLNNLKLTKSVTGYYFLKKTGAVKNRFKVILKTKPLFTKTGAYKKSKFVIDYDISQLSSGYNHFAINVNNSLGYMDLYVNGYRFQRVDYPAGKFALDNPLGTGLFLGAVSTPYNLTLANRLLQRGKYFLKDVRIKGFKMYSRPLDYYEIKTHINYHTLNKDSVWAIPVGQRVYTDTIDRVFKFNLPEKNTNTFDIELKNLGFRKVELLETLRDELEKEIKKITPYYDQLKEIVFKNNVSPDPNVIVRRLKYGETYDAPAGSCVIIVIDGIKYIKPLPEPEKIVVPERFTSVVVCEFPDLPQTTPTVEKVVPKPEEPEEPEEEPVKIPAPKIIPVIPEVKPEITFFWTDPTTITDRPTADSADPDPEIPPVNSEPDPSDSDTGGGDPVDPPAGEQPDITIDPEEGYYRSYDIRVQYEKLTAGDFVTFQNQVKDFRGYRISASFTTGSVSGPKDAGQEVVGKLTIYDPEATNAAEIELRRAQNKVLFTHATAEGQMGFSIYDTDIVEAEDASSSYVDITIKT